MCAVAIAACLLGIAISFTGRASASVSAITGCACAYAIPVIIIRGRRVPLKEIRYVVGVGIFVGAPFVFLYGMLGGLMSGWVGLVGSILGMTLMIGWSALIVAAFSTSGPHALDSDRSLKIDPWYSEVPDGRREKH
jgi:hypothetical protein